MVHEYPLVFKSDTIEETWLKALDHLFFVSQNGMEWYDGYLLDCNLSGVEWKKKETKHSNRIITKGPKYAEVRFDEPLDEEFMKTDKAEEVIKGKMKIMIPQRSRQPWFPAILTNNSRIYDVPKNVRLDWLAGASMILTEAIAFYADHLRIAKDDETFIAIMESHHQDALPKRERMAKKYIEGVEEKLRLAIAVILPLMKKKGISQGQELETIDGVIPKAD